MKQIAAEKQAAVGGLAARGPHVVFGGSFNPVHDGHLAVARAVRALLGTTVHFLPAGNPVHRDDPQASGLHRLAMLQIAIAHERGFAIDTRELARDGPSWTIDTIEELRSELPAGTPIVLVLGMDSLRQFTHWRRWQDILAQAHLVACTRPGQGMPTARELGELATHLAGDPEALRNSPGGRILIEATTAANMASTAIRAAFAAGQHPAGVNAAVRDYIEHHALYRPQP